MLNSISGNATTATKATQDGSGNTITSTYLKLSGGTMTGGITCTTSGANLKYGNITIYGAGSNGGINSMLVGDDVTIGDCNVGGCFGMKSTGTNAGFRFYNSSGSLIGGLQSTNGTLQWFNSSGTAYNVYHAGNKPTYSDVGAAAASHTHSYAASSHTHSNIVIASTNTSSTSTNTYATNGLNVR